MGSFDDALKNAVPGGNLATPLAIAAGACSWASFSAAVPLRLPPLRPRRPRQFRRVGGYWEASATSWRNFKTAAMPKQSIPGSGRGRSAPIQPGQLGSVLGQQTISDLARQSGMSEQELLAQLAKVLPNVVNNLTPNGRLPTLAELDR